MTIKQILENANRFEDVSGAINNIISTIDNHSYPVNPIIRDNSMTDRVDGKSIKEEAVEFLKLINSPSDSISIEDTTEKYKNLLEYVESKSDMMLHNYAVSISHKQEPHDDMELIRVLLIINSLIWWLNDDYEFDIPDGWKGVNKDA